VDNKVNEPNKPMNKTLNQIDSKYLFDPIVSMSIRYTSADRIMKNNNTSRQKKTNYYYLVQTICVSTSGSSKIGIAAYTGYNTYFLVGW